MLKRFLVTAVSTLIFFGGTHFAAADKAPAATELLVSAPQRRTFLMQVTAYCHCTKCCGKNAHGITASGKDVKYNGGEFVAADTSILPFGTKLSIPGYADAEPVEVIDRGGAIKGNHLDVFFPSHKEALKWGRRLVPVTVVMD
jgi:3D (Asp-Asp-Asp) domain-containing protein